MGYTAAVITVSDKGSRGERVDTSGPNLCEILKDRGFEVVYSAIVPDESERIQAELRKCADALGIALVLTTGGTGFSPRDITPEATLAVVERLADLAARKPLAGEPMQVVGGQIGNHRATVFAKRHLARQQQLQAPRIAARHRRARPFHHIPSPP